MTEVKFFFNSSFLNRLEIPVSRTSALRQILILNTHLIDELFHLKLLIQGVFVKNILLLQRETWSQKAFKRILTQSTIQCPMQ